MAIGGIVAQTDAINRWRTQGAEMVLMRSLLVMLMTVIAVGAGVSEDVLKCASIKGDAQRLECYDAVASRLEKAGSGSEPATGVGKWSVTTEQSPIDDTMNVYLSLEAEDVINTGYELIRPVLHLRCAEDKTTLYIVWNLYLGSGSILVLTRFDHEKASYRNWNISTDNKAIFAPGRDTRYAKKLMKHDMLLVRLTPSGRSPVTAAFDLSGLAAAIQPLQKACHWK